MEVVGVVASFIAVAELATKVSHVLSQYATTVSNARDDIERVQSHVKELETTLEQAQKLFNQGNNQLLPASSSLRETLKKCGDELEQLHTKLNADKVRRGMRRFGLRAMKWPLNKDDVAKVIVSLEQYRNNIMFSMQIDQTNLLLGINRDVQSLSLEEVQDPSAFKKSHFAIPFPRDLDFVNRPTVQSWIEEQYSSSCRRFALVGVGGIGKSQMAIEFAHRVKDNAPETTVFWVHAGTISKFELSYQSLADTFVLPGRKQPGVNILKLVCTFLQRDDINPWLMILDNADQLSTLFQSFDDEEQVLASYIPKTGNGKVLVTSRNLNVAERLTGSHKAILRISAMEEAEALKILENKLEEGYDEKTAAKLVRVLDCIPLAVNQAAAYINRRAPRSSLDSYLGEFQNSSKRGGLLNSDSGDLRRDDQVSNSIVVTWQVTFEQIRREKPTAVYLLGLMSLFHSQNIPDFMLNGYTRDPSRWIFKANSNEHDIPDDYDIYDQDGNDLENDIDTLRAYSLIQTVKSPELFDIHPMIQFCTKSWIEKSDKETFIRLKRVFLRSASHHFPAITHTINWTKCYTLTPHVYRLVEEEPTEKQDNQFLSSLLFRFLNYLVFLMKKYSAVESIAQKYLKIQRAMFRDNDVKTLQVRTTLAELALEQGKHTEAQLNQEQIIKAAEATLGENHPFTREAYRHLAKTYVSLGNTEVAKLIMEREIEVRRKLLGEDHMSTMDAIARLADIMCKQGQYAEAESLLRRASSRGREQGHVFTFLLEYPLSGILSKQQRISEAVSLAEQVVKDCKELLGEDDPQMLGVMFNLSCRYAEQGRWKELVTLMKELIARGRYFFGEEHPVILDSISCLTDLEKRANNRKLEN